MICCMEMACKTYRPSLATFLVRVKWLRLRVGSRPGYTFFGYNITALQVMNMRMGGPVVWHTVCQPGC